MRYDDSKTPFVKPRVIPHNKYILPFMFNQSEVLDLCPVLDVKSETSQSVHLQESRRNHAWSSEIGHLIMHALCSYKFPIAATTPRLPCLSSDKPPALSSPLRLSHRNPCSCPDSDLGHTAVLVLVAAGIAVVIVIAIAKLVLEIAIITWMFDGDVVNEKGNIGMVDWQKVRAKVQMRRRKRQRHSKRPWRSMWGSEWVSL